jgi:hypothetical protein
MSVIKVGPWNRASRILHAYAFKFHTVVDVAVRREAHRYEKAMKLGIRDQAPGGQKFRPLSPVTVHLKGSSKALIAKGDLMRSIGTKQFGPTAYFVGVHRTARNRQGRSIVNVAKVHEFGQVVAQKVTAKQARFFMALYMKGLWRSPDPRTVPREGDTVMVRTPKREFIKPVYKKLSPGTSKRIMQDILVGMGIAAKV